MFPDENEIRRALVERCPPNVDPWPSVRARLGQRPPLAMRRAAQLAAALVLFLATAEAFRRGANAPARGNPGFRVTGVSKDGRPANALVIQPDPNTILVIPQ